MKTFDEMIRGSYDYREADYIADPRWQVLERMYYMNHVYRNKDAKEGIPKKIHQIWCGERVFPNQYKRYADSWVKFNPDWEYKLWTEDNLNDVEIPNRDVFDTIKNVGQRSDFLRYNILNQFGGLYVDTDFECLKSFNPLSHLDFFTGAGFPARVELYIGIIASIPHHPIVEHIIGAMTEAKAGGWREIFETTGSYFFTRNFFEVVGNYMEGVVAFPTDYFYPFPNQAGHESRNGRDYIKENSYAVHHWAVSWRKS